MKVGFIGLGTMGSRMAANLQKSGHEIVVFNRTREVAASLVSLGATWAETPGAVGEQAEVLFTMLAHPAAVRETALGKNGFLDRLRPQTLWVDCSTVNPSFSREMASEAQARKVRFLDAPLAGSREPAATGTAGETSALEQRLAKAEEANERLHRALREAYHRYKNELGMLVGLIDMEMVQDAKCVSSDPLERLRTYIRTTTTLHDLLDKNVLTQEIGDPISAKALLDAVLIMWQTKVGKERLSFDVQDGTLSANRCRALALICSEVLTNAVKHGHLLIKVSFRVADGWGCLDVQDDGPGFPAGFDPKTSTHLGLELIESLSRHDLGGEVHYGNHVSGGQVRVSFPINPTDHTASYALRKT